MKYFTSAYALACAAAVAGFATSCSQEVPETHSETKGGEGGWQLVWSDEFDGPNLDSSKWRIRLAEPGFINNELERYTDRRENVRVENGYLVLEARRDFYQGAEYTSGRVYSEGKASWTYGRFEARIKLPGGVGTWPAFYLLPDDFSGGWPTFGELDIMEQVGYDPDTILAAHHSQSVHYTPTINVPGATDGYHIYAAEWFPDHIDVFVDGRKFFTSWNNNSGTGQWPFIKPFHITMNLAVGGHWGGIHGVDPNIWPRQMLVDYVRVYQWR